MGEDYAFAELILRHGFRLIVLVFHVGLAPSFCLYSLTPYPLASPMEMENMCMFVTHTIRGRLVWIARTLKYTAI